MTIASFNIDETVKKRFANEYKGDQSKIVESLISHYLEYQGKESGDVVLLKNELKDMENRIKILQASRDTLNKKLLTRQLAQEKVKKDEDELTSKKVDYFIESAKESLEGDTQLRYEAGKLNLTLRQYVRKLITGDMNAVQTRRGNNERSRKKTNINTNARSKHTNNSQAD